MKQKDVEVEATVYEVHMELNRGLDGMLWGRWRSHGFRSEEQKKAQLKDHHYW